MPSDRYAATRQREGQLSRRHSTLPRSPAADRPERRPSVRRKDLDLALARIRDNVGQLRGPVQRSAHGTLGRRIAARVKVAHLPYYLAAALSRRAGRHWRERASVAARTSSRAIVRIRPAATTGPRPGPGRQSPAKARQRGRTFRPTPISPAVPPARPAAAAQSSAPASDPIAALLAGETHDDGSHLIVAAQTALARLGYPVKPDGKEGAATEQALREFERAHGLPPATEITERLVKQLTQAARGGGR